MANEHKHDFHLVEPSPWPLLGAFAGLILATGFLWLMHPDLLGAPLVPANSPLKFLNGLKLLPGILLLIATFYFWWRDVVREGQGGFHTPVVQLGLRYGMMLFILSEVMFFVAFFWAYFNTSLLVTDIRQALRFANLGGQWPPKGIETINAFELPFVNTLILLLSGCTITWAHHALRENNRRDLIRGLTLTIMLGLAFSTIQLFEYLHAGFAMKDGIYGSTFYMATGFHGAHVLIGTAFLTICLLRARRGDFTSTQHFGLEAAAWYWHFVDVVWLFLFVSIYWLGG